LTREFANLSATGVGGLTGIFATLVGDRHGISTTSPGDLPDLSVTVIGEFRSGVARLVSSSSAYEILVGTENELSACEPLSALPKWKGWMKRCFKYVKQSDMSEYCIAPSESICTMTFA
jgi:hypothetical protein